MKVQVIDLNGNKNTEMTLAKGFVENASDTDILSQYIHVYRSNERQGTSSVKTRSEVSGSGAKPWKQKGTGRARVGDKRTPLWRHGGIIHGPKPKSWSLLLNKKVKQQALLTALSLKLNTEALIIVDSFDGLTKKTKDTAKTLKDLKLGRNILVVADKLNETMLMGLRNLKNVEYADVARINAYQVIKASSVLISKKAVEALEKKLIKK